MKNSFSRDFSKSIALAAWVALFGAYWWYTTANHLTPMETMQGLIDFVSESAYGFIFYVLAYMVRPVFLFPSTLLTMTATYLYGPLLGIGYALFASNLSTLVAYLIGRFFGSSFLKNIEQNKTVGQYADRLRRESFQTTMVLRFLFLPYDLVSYFSGLLNIDLRWFMLATILGSIPGTISFGLLGASVQGDFAAQSISLNPWALALSALMFGFSIVMYRLARKRERART